MASLPIMLAFRNAKRERQDRRERKKLKINQPEKKVYEQKLIGINKLSSFWELIIAEVENVQKVNT